MTNGEPSNEPSAAVEETVAAVVRQGAAKAGFPAFAKLEPWLCQLAAHTRFEVETVTISRSQFQTFLNDRDLLEHMTLKPWEDITDDMRVRHARGRVEGLVEESDAYLAIHPLKGHNGAAAVVAFLCADTQPPSIDRFLGAWPSVASFWADHLTTHIDTEFLPSHDEIVELWDHYNP